MSEFLTEQPRPEEDSLGQGWQGLQGQEGTSEAPKGSKDGWTLVCSDEALTQANRGDLGSRHTDLLDISIIQPSSRAAATARINDRNRAR